MRFDQVKSHLNAETVGFSELFFNACNAATIFGVQRICRPTLCLRREESYLLLG